MSTYITPFVLERRRLHLVAALAVCTTVFAACWNPFESEEPSWLQATILEADSAGTFEGTGVFHVGYPPPDSPLGVEVLFQVGSKGRDASEGDILVLSRFGEGRPGIGEYELGPWDGIGFTGEYHRSLDDGTRELYVVDSGSVGFTRSDDDRVEGLFRFTALLYCVSDPEVVWPGYECHPAEPLSNGPPPLEVEGSFSAGVRQPDWVVNDVIR